MRHLVGQRRLVLATLTLVVLAFQLPLWAAVIVVDGTTCTLVDAITAANSDSPTGGCTAGSGPDVLQLTADVSLASVNNITNGNNGLPSITSEILVDGVGGPKIITRSHGAPDFRLFHVASSGTLGLSEVTLTNGSSSYPPGYGRGGAVLSYGDLTLTSSTVSGSSAPNAGGGIANTYGSLALVDTVVTGNDAYYRGGGINSSGPVQNLTLTSSTVSNNTVVFGAGWGGGIFTGFGTTVLSDTTVSGNSALYGAGIYSRSDLRIDLSTVSGNTGFYGAGIEQRGSSLSLAHSTISGNSGGWGAGLWIREGASKTIERSTISDNTSTDIGGGILVTDGAAVKLIRSTVSSNYATNTGGGIMVADLDSSIVLYNTTVANNSADAGGGIYAEADSSVTLSGSILGLNLAPVGANCEGPIGSSVGNLADDSSCGTVPASLTGLDGNLGDNGGDTLTHALLSDSSAIDAAGAEIPVLDQRDFVGFDGMRDSGSYEFGAVDSRLFADGFESGDATAWST